MKKLTSALLTIAFIISTAGPTLAASGKCTVVGVEENKVILDCGDKADKFPVGSEVKVKTSRSKAIEGC